MPFGSRTRILTGGNCSVNFSGGHFHSTASMLPGCAALCKGVRTRSTVCTEQQHAAAGTPH
eukprot:COSAG02_NODE_42958_length_379_cov_1.092857_1_plen_60_part_10